MNFFSLFKRNLIFKLKKKINIDKEAIEFSTIDDLFHHFGSDKSNILRFSNNNKNNKGHGFSNLYSKHLEIFKDKQINILEVGSFSGASAASFVKYFPKSKVFCFDINISNFKYYSKNIEVFGMDISDVKKTEKTIKTIFEKYNFQEFDLIIDDGSHNLSDILICINTLFKYLKKKGIFVIEDFKFPNYYSYNKNVDDVYVDDLIKYISSKRYFNSKIINRESQTYFFNSVEKINSYKGNLTNSDICFIKKN